MKILLAVLAIVIIVLLFWWWIYKPSADLPTVSLHFVTWCPHCTDFKKIWIDAEASFRGLVHFVAVDEDVAKNKAITSYPTVLGYDSANAAAVYHYTGKTKKDFYLWIGSLVGRSRLSVK